MIHDMNIVPKRDKRNQWEGHGPRKRERYAQYTVYTCVKAWNIKTWEGSIHVEYYCLAYLESVTKTYINIWLCKVT